jgi:uncharacterized protein DUF6544
MALWAKLTLIVLCVIVAALILTIWIGSIRWSRALSKDIETLLQTTDRTGTARVSLAELDNLPEPVLRYFRRVLREGHPYIRVARLRQTGELRTDTQSDRWLLFQADQVVTALSPGFVWNAKADIAPFIHVRVRDAYIAGQGSGEVSLLSAVTVAAERGRFEMNSGALHRYLAEAVWYPTALLPSAYLEWSPIDDNKALASLTDSGITVRLEFSFNDAGEVTGIYTPGRWGAFDGGYKQVPWEGHFRKYEDRDGMWVPTEGEVGWYSSSEWQSVWKGTIAEVSYEFVR